MTLIITALVFSQHYILLVFAWQRFWVIFLQLHIISENSSTLLVEKSLNFSTNDTNYKLYWGTLAYVCSLYIGMRSEVPPYL